MAALVCMAAPSARAATIEVRCPGMPLSVEEDLWARASRLLTDSGMAWATVGLECGANGAWLVWVDGSRMGIDQSRGMVQGVLDLIQSRLAADRYAAANPGAVYAPPVVAIPNVETPPSVDRKYPTGAPGGQKRGAEGGIGVATVAQFWSGASSFGFGPRLDVSVGPPGNFAVLLSEEALFGTGAEGSGIVMFDFQFGGAYGAPFKARNGFGAIAMLGAERVSSSHDNSSNGLYMWAFTGNLGARGSLPWASSNIWLGADVLLRSSDFHTGGPSPVSIPNASFVLSLGCFFPAFSP